MLNRKYQENISILIRSFKQLDVSDTKELLGWFYDATEYNSLFEIPTADTFIAKRIQDAGYPITLDKAKYFVSINDFLNGKVSELRELELALIATIMSHIIMGEQLDMVTISLLRIYNLTYNKEKTTSKMMKNMREYIGNQVVCVGYRDSERYFINGRLDDVQDFESITVDDIVYQFVGENEALSTVRSSDGKELYTNILIKSDYKLQDEKSLNDLSYATFGNVLKKVA